MPDLIPEDCISLYAAYDTFAFGLWSCHHPVSELRDRITYNDCPPQIAGRSNASLDEVTNAMLAEFRNAFATGSLGALVRPPGALENFVIPQDTWATVHFPERVFLDEQIVHRQAGYWDGLVGRTPFVRRSEFAPWLSANIDRKHNADATPSPAVLALRSHLIGLAANGLLPSAEIEKLASKWGLSPIASRPAEGSCDPMGVSHWTLAMAVAWIAWRDISCVREAMDTYRSDCWEWKPFSRRFSEGGRSYEIFGEELETLAPLSLSHLRGLEALGYDAWDHPMVMSIKSARETLWRYMGEGAISAAAVDDAGNHVTVPQHQWAALELAESRSGQDYLVFSHNLTNSAYTRVAIPRTSILSIWVGAVDLVASENQVKTRPAPKERRKTRLEAARQALADLYPEGIPAGLSAKERLAAVNAYLRQKGSSAVSLTTILRALGYQ